MLRWERAESPDSIENRMKPESLPLAVVMECLRLQNRWVSEKWEAHGVVEDGSEADSGPRVIFEDEQRRHVLHPGLRLELYRDEAENYYLNLTSPQPRVFVLWRADDGDPKPALVSVSYGEAARWMDGGETVDGVAMPPQIYAWVGEFVERHYRPQPKKVRQRK
jgi:uncharacterized protein DUF3305